MKPITRSPDHPITRFLAGSLLLLVSILSPGQQPPAASDYVATSITFPLNSPPQQVNVRQVSLQFLDNPGNGTYCYWIVSNYLIGNSAPAGPVCVSNGPNILVSGIRVSWSGVIGATSYDVLRTSTSAPPSGACGCAVATGVTTQTAIDTGLNAYTVSTFNPASLQWTISNEPQSAGISNLSFRVAGVKAFGISQTGPIVNYSNLIGGGFPSATSLPNSINVDVQGRITSVGNNDLYTVPANRRACVIGLYVNNTGGAASTVTAQIKISGTYFPLSLGTSVPAAGLLQVFLRAPYVAEAGEILSVNVSAQPVNVFYTVIEFDNTASFKTLKLTSLSAGNNTLYTVAAGKTALVITSGVVPGNASSGPIGYINNSGAARTVSISLVLNGGSPGTSNQILTNGSASSPGSLATIALDPTLGSGDFVVINVDAGTATQFAWITVIEF